MELFRLKRVLCRRVKKDPSLEKEDPDGAKETPSVAWKGVVFIDRLLGKGCHEAALSHDRPKLDLVGAEFVKWHINITMSSS
jgi:hypothetical protein